MLDSKLHFQPNFYSMYNGALQLLGLTQLTTYNFSSLDNLIFYIMP
jgi:hypothetical protein